MSSNKSIKEILKDLVNPKPNAQEPEIKIRNINESYVPKVDLIDTVYSTSDSKKEKAK